VPVETNPIDALWEDRPKPSAAPLVPHGLEYSGRSAKDKILDVQDVLKQEKLDAVLLTMLDSIAWLFNIRGGDIRHTPVALAYALVLANGRPILFVDGAKVGDNVRGDLSDLVEIAEPSALADKIKSLGQSRARVRLDPETAPMRFAKLLEAEGAKFAPGPDPCTQPKAVKNAV
jgi:Xaa-Pro aminopeptidase